MTKLQQKLQQDSQNYINTHIDIYETVGQIIQQLDNDAIKELSGGYSDDIDKVLEILAAETKDILSSPTRSLQKKAFGLDAFSESVEETLRCRSMNYFILTCLPDFILGWHNLEWSNLISIYRLLCIIAARDHGKSLGTSELVVMSTGLKKRVDELVVGDMLMGPDSLPRRITALHRGKSQLYKVNQSRGDSYIVNKYHTLSLYKKWKSVYCGKKGHFKSDVAKLVDIDIEDFRKKSKNYKNIHKGYKVITNFSKQEVFIDPYYLGLRLGNRTQSITDHEIPKYINQFAEENNLIEEKHIPDEFIYNTKEIRLKMLAGLIDSDGSVEDNQIIFTQPISHRRLIDDIERICHTLGLHCVKKDTISKFNGKSFPSIRLKICGEILKDIPVLLERKKMQITSKSNSIFNRPKYYLGDNQNYDISNISTIDIEDAGVGEYISISIDGDKRFLLGDNTVCHNSYHFSFAYPLWQMYRYRPLGTYNHIPTSGGLWMSEEGMLVTNEYKLGITLMDKIREEIEVNPILNARLMPDSKAKGWGSEKINCKNGSSFYTRSANSKIRGLHPTYIVMDDFLNESSLYSAEQREKYWNIFSAVIYPALSPNGQLLIVGTPFFELDMYGVIKKKGPEMKEIEAFPVLEYPAIFPDGTLLFPERHTFQNIMQKRTLLGSLIFSREIMVKPIADAASIFPYSTLEIAIKGQENTRAITNIDSSLTKYVKIVVGCDFAISSEIKADFTVFTIMGVDDRGIFHVLNSVRMHGANYKKQIAGLKKINRDFRPDIMYAEDNGMQQIFIQMMEDAQLPVVGKTTNASNKKSLYKGIPSIAVLFESGRIKFPYGDQRSKDLTDIYFAELNSITYIQDTGKLESTTQHDDCAMSLWQGINACKGEFDDFDFSFV